MQLFGRRQNAGSSTTAAVGSLYLQPFCVYDAYRVSVFVTIFLSLSFSPRDTPSPPPVCRPFGGPRAARSRLYAYVSYGSPDTNGNERRNQQQFSRLNVTALHAAAVRHARLAFVLMRRCSSTSAAAPPPPPEHGGVIVRRAVGVSRVGVASWDGGWGGTRNERTRTRTHTRAAHT